MVEALKRGRYCPPGHPPGENEEDSKEAGGDKRAPEQAQAAPAEPTTREAPTAATAGGTADEDVAEVAALHEEPPLPAAAPSNPNAAVSPESNEAKALTTEQQPSDAATAGSARDGRAAVEKDSAAVKIAGASGEAMGEAAHSTQQARSRSPPGAPSTTRPR